MTDREFGLDITDTVIDRLSGYARDRLLRLAHSEAFDTGAVILHEGKPTPFLGVVESGRVALQLRIPELGERVTLLTVERGELLGWSAIVAPFIAMIDAVALEPTTLLAFDAVALRMQLERDCDLASELLPLVIESLSVRLAGSWHQLLDLFATRTPEPW